jgi:hypothetical protein
LLFLNKRGWDFRFNPWSWRRRRRRKEFDLGELLLRRSKGVTF